MITLPLVGSLVRGCASWSMTIATPLIPAVKASAKALSMGSLPSSASILHWLFAWAILHRIQCSLNYFDGNKCLIEGHLKNSNARYHPIKINKIHSGMAQLKYK